MSDRVTLNLWVIVDKKDPRTRRGYLAPYIGHGVGNMPAIYRTRKDAEIDCIQLGYTPVKVKVTVVFP